MQQKNRFTKISLKAAYIVCAFLAASINVSCGSAANNISKSTRESSTITTTGNISEAYPTTLKRETPYSKPEAITDSDTPEDVQDINTARATKLTSKIRTMEEIDTATVVVNNSTALVGISIKNDLGDEEIKSLKKVIEGKILESDKKIKRVAITTAPELTEKISHIAHDTLEGRPKDTPKISNDLENALKRVSPTI